MGINSKLGLKPAGHRARMDALSGIACPRCPHHDVVSNVIHGTLEWMCAWCGYGWTPTAADVTAYNARVRGRDRIEVR